jgi:RimJ/RimL family protein N-acetyltransferase
LAKAGLETLQNFNVEEHAVISDYYKSFQDYPGPALELASDIADLYKRTYRVTGDVLRQRSYPYPEVFDPEWIHEIATDMNTIWKVVFDRQTDKVVGSGTIMLNNTNKRAYIRGVVIDPNYQGCGLGGFIMVNAFKEIINEYCEKVRIFSVEARTAHDKSQKMAEVSGMRPVALFPNKDFFLGRRESDILLVLYAMNTLKTRRTDVQLVPEAMPIFEVIGHQFRLTPADRVPIPKIDRNRCQVKGKIINDKYLYCYATYEAGGRQLKFMLNPRTQVAEKTYFTPNTDPETLKTLLRFAMISLQPNLYYIECNVSAYEPRLQQVFIDLGFTPTGFLPGWEVRAKKREDVVIMTWVREQPSFETLKLTRRATKIAHLFLS